MRLPDLAPAPRSPRTWPSWLGIGLLWLIARLPLRWTRALGRVFGLALMPLAGRRRRIAERNLALCLPEHDAATRARALRENFASTGMAAAEFIHAWWGPLEPWIAQAPVEGVEHIRAAFARGQGVILLSGHFHTLELCGRILCQHVPVAGMYRPHGDPALEWAVMRGRLRYASAMFTRDEVRPAVKHLKAGGLLWYAPDQDMRGKDAVFAPFFGIPASSITATHALARMSGAAVIGFFHRRRADGRGYELRIEPALTDFPSADPIVDTTRVNALIERMVREAPSEYLWIHRRFHRRPPGEAKLY